MKKVKALEKGDCIGIIAPSSPVSDFDILDNAIKRLKESGYEVKEGKNLRNSYGYLAGTDAQRIEDIESMFADESVDAIFCVKGGYGTPRIVQDIDVSIIKQNPKIFVGFSDITALHILFNQQADLITFHGPMVTFAFGKTILDFTKNSFLDNLQSTTALGEIRNPEKCPVNCLVEGVAEGLLTGGNLSLVVSTLGTKHEIDTAGKILFLEDVDEEPYRIDRMLMQLKNAGKLHDCAGIILGDWANCVPKSSTPPSLSLSIQQIVQDIIIPIGIPTISGLKAGHCEPTLTLAMGAKYSLDAENLRLNMLESACE